MYTIQHDPRSFSKLLFQTFICILLLSSQAVKAEYHWADEYQQQEWGTHSEACYVGEVNARKSYLDVNYPQNAPHYSTVTSDLESPVKSYCGWVIYHYTYIPGYGYSQVTDNYGSVYHSRDGRDGKEKGCSNEAHPSTMTGNPCDIFTGNKFHQDTDISLEVVGLPFSFTRTYNSLENSAGTLGAGWRHSFEMKLDRDGSEINLQLEDGKELLFILIDGQWQHDPDIRAELIPDGTGWLFESTDDRKVRFNQSGLPIEILYNNGYTQNIEYFSGRLHRIYDNVNQSIEFGYNADGLMTQLSHPATARSWQYQYDGQNNLQTISYPDGTQKEYHYENTTFSHALTGITDRRGIRYATYAYDSAGFAISTEHAGGVEKREIDLSEIQYGFSTVTDSMGRTISYGGEIKLGAPRANLKARDNENLLYEYTDDNQLSKITRNGIITELQNYDANNNPKKIIKAKGTNEERLTNLTYDSRFLKRITTRTEPSVSAGHNKVTTYSYDDNANLLSQAVAGFQPDGTAISRAISYQYNGPLNQLSLIDGPRTDVSDVTHYRYYPLSLGESYNSTRLKEIEDASGVLIRSNIQYTSTGKIASENRPNNHSLSYIYLPGNDRLETLTETAGGESRTTKWTYLPTGEIQSVTTAFGSTDATTISLVYDDARRLTRIVDALGNYIEYTLDTEGNTLQESVHDTNNVLRKQLSRTFDVYDRLDTSSQENETSNDDYSPNGTLAQSTDGNGSINTYDYDNLLRLTKITQAQGNLDVQTSYEYDVADRLTKVTDPNGNDTTTIYDDLGNLLSETSPDTGTQNHQYDTAGNLIHSTDAKGQTFTFSYNVLNQLVAMYAPSTVDDTSYAYGGCSNGEGKLCSITVGSPPSNPVSITYAYGAFGEVSTHQGVSYSYDHAGRMKTVTYPSGAVISTSYDAAGRTSQVQLSLDGQTSTLVSSLVWNPSGMLTDLTYGNGKTRANTIDLASRITSITVPDSLSYVHQYDANGNLLQRDENADATVQTTYVYDVLDRLTQSNGVTGSHDYQYDTNSNRTILTANGVLTTYSYAPSSNHLISIENDALTLDANGNTLTVGSRAYAYNAINRLKTVTHNNTLLASYTYNGLGQRTHKQVLANTPITPITPTEPQTSTVYEDGENGDTTGWDIYDPTPAGASISNVLDADSNSNVIELSGDGRTNGYRLGHNNANHANAWDNTTEKVISWDAKFSEPVSVFIGTQTTLGFRYLYYTDRNSDLGIRGTNNNYIHNGIGTQLRDGNWHTINRDLEADLQKFEPNNQILSVNGFLIRGSGRLDNITLLKNLPPIPPPAPEVIYEDAEDSNTTGWDIYDPTPTGATLANVEDADSNSRVIELTGTARQNGYRLGHNNANNAKAWNNRYNQNIAWDAKFSEPVSVFIATETTLGFRYLYYTDRDTDLGIIGSNNNYIHHGIGSNLRDGNWHTITRNLEADLQAFEPDNEIVSVNGFLTRGSGRVDNIKMFGLDAPVGDIPVGDIDTDYVYDLQGRLISEISENNRKEYVYLNGQPLAMIEAGQVYYYHNDHLGTPQVMTDQNQNTVWKANYAPFGKASISTATVKSNLRFAGQYFDAESDLHYNYFRYYDAEIGRYVTSDPIGLAGGINTYGYANSNPLYYTDPYGLFGVADLPSFPQGFVDFSAGLGDSLLLGFGDELRNIVGVDGGIDECSSNYNAGGWASFAFGGSRLAYAGAVKGYSLVASSGVAASQFRNQTKNLFRLGAGKNWRRPDLSKYSTDDALRAGAGRTNTPINVYGAGVAGAGAYQGSGCGCTP